MTEDLNQIIQNYEEEETTTETDILNPSSFVCAALPSVRQHLEGVFKLYPDFTSVEWLKSFFSNTSNKFLSSYGLGMDKNKPIDENVTKRYKKSHFDKFTNSKFLEDIELTVDSGGYQLQVGYGKKEETDRLIELYHDFIKTEHEKIDYAFVLDLAPGATTCLYDSWGEMEEYNIKSYQASIDLPSDIKNKMIYIHHFRTPKIRDIWMRMLNDGMGDEFSHFGTGGIVSFSKSSNFFPIVMYVLPLIQVLQHAKQRNLKKFRFHVLGGSEFKDILFHKFAEYHIKKVHDIDVEITYDSSTIFKAIGLSRQIYIPNWDENQLWKTSIREDDLYMNFKNTHMTNEDWFYKLSNEAGSQFGFPIINKENSPIYTPDPLGRIDKQTKQPRIQFSRISYQYGIMLMLKLYMDVGLFGKRMVTDTYSIYENGQTDVFDKMIENVMIGWNNGKTSRRVNSRTMSFVNSLDALTQLDLDYCDYLIDRYMGQDECPQLTGQVPCEF